MQKKSLKPITYGAMICAIAGVLIYINRQTAGMFDLYMMWILPLPIIVYGVKFDLKSTVIMSVALLIMSAIISTPSSLFYIAAATIAGNVYVYGLKKGKSSSFLIGSVILVSMFTTIITMYLFAGFFGYDINEEINFIVQTINQVGTTLGYSENIISTILSHNTILTLLVISDLLVSVMEGVIVHLLTYLVLRKLKMELPPMKNIFEKKAPTWIKVLLIGVLACDVMILITKVTKYNDIVLPLRILAGIICVYYGYILLSLYLTITIKNPKTRKFVLFIICVLIIITYRLLILFGVFDIFTNIRYRFIALLNSSFKENKDEQKN